MLGRSVIDADGYNRPGPAKIPRTRNAQYSYFYVENRGQGQSKAVSGGERAVNGLERFRVQGSGFNVGRLSLHPELTEP